MKKHSFQQIESLVILASILLAIGCADNDPSFNSLEELSPEAKAFLGMRNGANQALSAAGNSNPATASINKSYQGAYNSYATVSGAEGVSENTDTTVIEPYPYPGWESCANITQTINPDGSTTTTTDYGDGCEEGNEYYKYFMHGKNIYTYKYGQTQSGSVFKYTYFTRYRSENFGGKYYYESDTSEWVSNGRSTYSGESQYDSLDHSFSGYYAHSDTSEYTYDDITYIYKSIGETMYDDHKSVVEASNYEYSYGGDFYKSEVLIPLVTDYTCMSPSMGGVNGGMMMPYWSTYVSGRERIQFKQGDSEGNFEIDYGNGACDNIIVIYENGKVFSVDLSKDYAMLKGG